jgi:two-component system KDP operon response regulator KdpE
LRRNGYRCSEAPTTADGLAVVGGRAPDLVVVDLDLPEGLDALRALRQASAVPIVALSSKDTPTDKVAALDIGADDYVAKPFAVEELIARVRAVLRRHAQQLARDGKGFTRGEVKVDLEERSVFIGERAIELTRTEYRLLAVLVRHAGRVVTHGELLREVWGQDATTQTQYLHVYMRHLRSKLEAQPAHPELLLTAPGVGYLLRAD